MPFLPNSTLFPYTTLFRSVTDGTLSSNVATVTVTVASVNDAPVANDDALAATEDTPVTFTAADLLGNDTDADLDTLTIASVTSGSGGTATLNADGTVTFVANANFHGAADFTYTVTDGTVGSKGTTLNATDVSVTDAPVAFDEELAATEDTPVTFTPPSFPTRRSSDLLDTLTIASVTSGSGGTATLNADGTVTFVANANFHGAADFTYTVTDGT